MSGVTDMPFRRLVKRMGAGPRRVRDDRQPGDDPADRQTLLMAKKSAEEFPMAVQLAGCEPR
jgi:tRNA-dihydrouridine synthase B